MKVIRKLVHVAVLLSVVAAAVVSRDPMLAIVPGLFGLIIGLALIALAGLMWVAERVRGEPVTIRLSR